MVTQIKLGDIEAELILKDIKNVHLSVYPPTGHVRISAPERMTLDNVRAYAVSKLDWIKNQQRKLRAQERETRREYVDRESHYLWGKRYLLLVKTADAPAAIRTHARRLELQVRPDFPQLRRGEVMEGWYRDQIRAVLPSLIERWEGRMGVTVGKVLVRRMKTKWGSCSPPSGAIRLNTELAKKPVECLEYILVHEMAHLIEPSHNARFVALMNDLLPKWKFYKDELNRLPVRHETWRY